MARKRWDCSASGASPMIPPPLITPSASARRPAARMESRTMSMRRGYVVHVSRLPRSMEFLPIRHWFISSVSR
jgi:hypothetical protein